MFLSQGFFHRKEVGKWKKTRKAASSSENCLQTRPKVHTEHTLSDLASEYIVSQATPPNPKGFGVWLARLAAPRGRLSRRRAHMRPKPFCDHYEKIPPEMTSHDGENGPLDSAEVISRIILVGQNMR